MNTPTIAGADTPHRTKPTIPRFILIIGLALPTAITWVYFVALATSPPSTQQIAFTTGKLLQFALPIIAWVLWQRFDSWDNSPPHNSNNDASVSATSDVANALPVAGSRSFITNRYAIGILTGVVISLAIFAVYFAFLLPFGFIDDARIQAKEKLREIGMSAPWQLFLIASFYSLFHSGFEEFYWRRFVFRGLLCYSKLTPAILISSLGFMSHHVLVVARYFGWDSPLTYALSLGVAVGGAIWAVMLVSYRSLIPGWISHAIVDAALFAIAFHLTMG